MECPSCGANLRDNAVFCSSCGHRVGGPNAASAVGSTVQVPVPPRERPVTPPPPAAVINPTVETQRPTFAPPPPRTPPEGTRPAPNLGGAPGLGGSAARPRSAGADPTKAFGYLTRLLKLDTSAFRDARDDPGALIPSFIVVAAALVLASLGTLLWAQIEFGEVFDGTEFFLKSVLVGTLFGVGLWAAWIATAAVLLSNLSKQRVAVLPLLGALGFAMLPMAIGLLAFIDVLHVAFGVAAVAASAMLTQVGLQEATDAPPGHVFLANLAGFALFAVALGFLGQIDNAQLAPGIFAQPAISFDVPDFSDLFRP